MWPEVGEADLRPDVAVGAIMVVGPGMDRSAKSVTVPAQMADSTPVTCEPGRDLYAPVLVVYEVNIF